MNSIDQLTGRWFEALFEVYMLVRCKIFPKIGSKQKVFVNTSESSTSEIETKNRVLAISHIMHWSTLVLFHHPAVGSPEILTHYVKMLLSRHSFRKDALHHFPSLPFHTKVFSHVGFKLPNSPTSSSLLSGFGNHGSPP